MTFTENGLDPNQYGIFCYDEWYEIDGVTVQPNSNGDYPDDATKHGRYGIRYDELFAFIIGAM